MSSWTVTIVDWRPPSLNVLMRLHHYQRSRNKKAISHMIGIYARLANVTRAAEPRRVRINITYTGRQKEMDRDNVQKVLLDALVACEALVDDSPTWLQGVEIHQERGKLEQTVIVIEEGESNEQKP